LDWTREVLENVEQGAFDAELDWMRGPIYEEALRHPELEESA